MTVAISIDGLTVRFSAPTPLRERLRRERRTLAAVLDGVGAALARYFGRARIGLGRGKEKLGHCGPF